MLRGKFGLTYQIIIKNLNDVRKRIKIFQNSGGSEETGSGDYYKFNTLLVDSYTAFTVFNLVQFDGTTFSHTLTSNTSKADIANVLNSSDLGNAGTWRVDQNEKDLNVFYLFRATKEPTQLEIQEESYLLSDDENFYLTNELGEPITQD